MATLLRCVFVGQFEGIFVKFCDKLDLNVLQFKKNLNKTDSVKIFQETKYFSHAYLILIFKTAT